MLSSPQTLILWVECTEPVDTSCCPERLALWMLSFTFMALSSSGETSAVTLEGAGTPQQRQEGQQAAGSVVVLIPCVFQSERAAWQCSPGCRDTVPWVHFGVTPDFQFSMTVPQFSNKFRSILIFCGIIKVDPFCRASRKKIHYCTRRSKRAKVENICVPSTAV